MNIARKIRQKIKGISPQQAEMQYLLSQGLRVGEKLRNHSDYAFDALFPWLISVGDNVCISANVKILAHDTSTEYVNGYTKIGTVSIGNNVYIGYGVTVLCNVRIGDNCIIGAGSIVSHDLPADTVCVGNPARPLCTIEEYRKKHTDALNRKSVFDGPCMKWHHEKTQEDRNAMREALKDTFGYMK